MKFCKLLKSNGYCTKNRPTLDFDGETVIRVPHKCLFEINDVQLVKYKKKDLYVLAIPDKIGEKGCNNFEPVDNLEKMLSIFGELKFRKKNYVMGEDDSFYYLIKYEYRDLFSKDWWFE